MKHRSLCGATVAFLLLAAAPRAGWPQAKPAPPAVKSSLPKTAQATQLELRAEDLQAAGKAAEAAALFQQAAELTADDWRLWEKAGWAHLDNEQAAAALKAFESARKAAPSGTPPSGGLLISYFALNHKAEVLELVKQSVPPERVEEASAIVTKALAAKQFTPDWSFALGYLYSRVVRNDARALAPMEAVVKANPANAQAWLFLVEINQSLDRAPQEAAAARKYLDLAPDTADAFRLKAQRYAVLQQYADAAREYEAGIAKHPTVPELYFQLARLRERTGGAKQAEATYRKLIAVAEAQKLAGTAALGRAQLASFQARQHNYIEAEKYYREVAGRPEATVSTWETWGALLALTGKWDEAARAMEGASERDQKLRGGAEAAAEELLLSRYRAAVCRLAAGQRDAAKSGLEAAVASPGEPRNLPRMEASAFLLWLTGGKPPLGALAYQRSDERWAALAWRREQVEGELEVRGRFSPVPTGWRAILQQIQKKYPDCWPADYALARIYATAGFNDEATGLLSRVTRARADWWAPQFAVGQYYARRRDKERGVPALRKTLQLAPECRGARVYLSLLTNLKQTEEKEPDDTAEGTEE